MCARQDGVKAGFVLGLPSPQTSILSLPSASRAVVLEVWSHLEGLWRLRLLGSTPEFLRQQVWGQAGECAFPGGHVLLTLRSWAHTGRSPRSGRRFVLTEDVSIPALCPEDPPLRPCPLSTASAPASAPGSRAPAWTALLLQEAESGAARVCQVRHQVRRPLPTSLQSQVPTFQKIGSPPPAPPVSRPVPSPEGPLRPLWGPCLLPHPGPRRCRDQSGSPVPPHPAARGSVLPAHRLSAPPGFPAGSSASPSTSPGSLFSTSSQPAPPHSHPCPSLSAKPLASRFPKLEDLGPEASSCAATKTRTAPASALILPSRDTAALHRREPALSQVLPSPQVSAASPPPPRPLCSHFAPTPSENAPGSLVYRTLSLRPVVTPRLRIHISPHCFVFLLFFFSLGPTWGTWRFPG